MRTSIYTAVDTDPEQYAELQRAGRRLGMPAAILPADRTERQRLEVSRDATLDDLPATHPKTAEFLSDPENSKLAWDDVQALAKVEGLFKNEGSTANVMGIATTQDRANAKRMRDVVSAAATGLYSSPETLQKGFASTGRLFAEGTAWTLRNLGMEEGAAIWQGAADTAKESAGIWESGAKAKLSPTTPGTLPSYLQQAAQSVGVSALAAPFGIAGEGSALTMFALSADGNYDELKQAGVSTPLAIALSLSGKSMEGLTEKIGMDALYQGGKPLVKRMTGFVLRDLLGEEVNTIYSAVADKVTVQPDMTFADLGQRVLDTAIVTALAGPMQGVIFDAPARGAQHLADSMASSARAQETRRVMAALGEAATESKLQTRLPERFREFVRMAREDGPVDNIYVPASEWRTYWQDKNIDPQAMAGDVVADGGNQYLEALATNGDMVIPIEAYAEKLAATEHHTDLSQHVRLRQGDMTLVESEAFEAERDAKVKELVEQVRAEAEAATVNRPAWLKVYDDLYGQLQGVFPRDTAEKYATLGAVRARTRAERLGLDAFDLYNEQPLKVGRPLPEALRKRTVNTGVDPFLDRLRAADIPTDESIFGQSLLQFVRERGVADDRGDLRQMEVDAIRKPGQKNIIRPDGMALDKVREAATEAGYLPEGSTVNDLLTAIDNEMRGNPFYSTRPIDERAFETRATLDQLREELDRRGIDINQMDNDAIRRQMFQGGQGGELWQSDPVIRLSGIEVGDNITAENAVELARVYFKEHLQGGSVTRRDIGEIRITGKGWKKLRRGLTTDPLKVKLIPAIRAIIEKGEHQGREGLTKERTDDIVAFHFFTASVEIEGMVVEVSVSVAEDSFGNLFYNLNHDPAALMEKRKAPLLPRVEARGAEPSLGGGEPTPILFLIRLAPMSSAVLAPGIFTGAFSCR